MYTLYLEGNMLVVIYNWNSLSTAISAHSIRYLSSSKTVKGLEVSWRSTSLQPILESQRIWF